MKKVINFIKPIYQHMINNPIKISLMFLVVLVAVISLYIVEVNKIATRGHLLSELDLALYELKQEKNEYLLEQADLRSMERIEMAISALDMKNISNKEYLENSAVTFAKR